MKIYNSYVNFHKWNSDKYMSKYPNIDCVPYWALYQRGDEKRRQLVKAADLYEYLKTFPGSYTAYPRITGRRNDKYSIKYNQKHDSFEIYCTRFAPCVGSINATTGEWICWNPKIFRNKPLWIWDKLFLKDGTNYGKVSLWSNTKNAKFLGLRKRIEELQQELDNMSEEQPCCKGE